MKLLFVCGGTGGHINPAIAVAGYIQERHPKAEILFVGNPRGMETRLVPQAGFPIETVDIMGFERKVNVHNLKHNVRSIRCLLTCSRRIREILENFQPQVVIGTGGYVTTPVLRTAHKMGIKTVAHEQNAYPGVSNKLSFQFVDRILLACEDAKQYLPKGKDYVVTGNPVREEIMLSNRVAARKELEIGSRCCILTFGGSLGATKINEAVADVMAWHQARSDVYHIHATGKNGKDHFLQLLQQRGIVPEKLPHLDVREYIDNMAKCLAAADLVIARSGASTLSELQAAGKASILIPSPNVAENHQYFNAKSMSDKDAAILLEEKNLNQKTVCKIVEDMITNPERRKQLGVNASNMAYLDANQRIYEQIMELLH